jgi:N-acetylmuramoyl-L-alanine amidase
VADRQDAAECRAREKEITVRRPNRLVVLAVVLLVGSGVLRAADAAKPTTPAPAPYKPTVRADGRRIVALDIGHTKSAPGAISASGVPEFEFNRRIVMLVNDLLAESKVVAPVVINPDGLNITLPERTRRAALSGASLFIAVHHDSANDKYLQTQEVSGKKMFYSDRFEGYGVFISKKNPDFDSSLKFARLVGGELERNLPFASHHSEAIRGENRPILDSERGIYEYDDLIVLKTALMPAALVECGVIINREQDLLLRQPAMQKIIATAIATSIETYFAPRQ